MEKFRIFEQNSGLTPWKNSKFFTFLKKHFYSLESLSTHLEYELTYISRLIFFEKQTMGKVIIFDQNRGLTPLEKFKFFHFFKKAFLWFRKPFFLSRISTKYISMLIFLEKTKNGKKFEFLIKIVD